MRKRIAPNAAFAQSFWSFEILIFKLLDLSLPLLVTVTLALVCKFLKFFIVLFAFRNTFLAEYFFIPPGNTFFFTEQEQVNSTINSMI